jgi:hypothetical protein
MTGSGVLQAWGEGSLGAEVSLEKAAAGDE